MRVLCVKTGAEFVQRGRSRQRNADLPSAPDLPADIRVWLHFPFNGKESPRQTCLHSGSLAILPHLHSLHHGSRPPPSLLLLQTLCKHLLAAIQMKHI